MAIDQKLLEILACPNCRGDVEYIESRAGDRLPRRVRLPLSGARRHPGDADRRGREAVSVAADRPRRPRADRPTRFGRRARSRRALRGSVPRRAGRSALTRATCLSADGVDAILVLGMGGRASPGTSCRRCSRHASPFPLSVIKSYGPLPEWVGRNTLVFAVSYSGNTEETIAARGGARPRRACWLRSRPAGRLADGGRVRHRARRDPFRPAAPGFPRVPRASDPSPSSWGWGSSCPCKRTSTRRSTCLETFCESCCHRNDPVAENPAKELARGSPERSPVVYGGHGLWRRWPLIASSATSTSTRRPRRSGTSSPS